MKKILIAAAAALALLACEQKPEPVKDALAAYLQEVSGEKGKLTVYSLEKVDSTTFGEELERKVKLYELKIEQNTRFYETYLRERKPKTAARKMETITKDRERLEGLAHIKEQLSDRLDEVVYYDYRFSGKGDFETFVSEYRDHYFAITPELKILGLSPDQNNIHKNTSKVLPGYMELLDGED